MALPQTLIIKGLTKIATDPQAIGRLLNILDSTMPNIEKSTMGGTVFWTNIAHINGWKLQKHIVFGNCRILDPNNVRKAWGGEQAILKAFEKL
jgi:hypothetical protein